MTVWRVELGTDKLKIGELALAAGVTKRTIDYYTNVGLLQAQRSASNYRYYSASAVHDIMQIETWKHEGLTLDQIRKKLHNEQAVDIDLHELRLKMRGLEKEVSILLAQLDQTDAPEHEKVKQNVTTESLALVQALVLLLNS